MPTKTSHLQVRVSPREKAALKRLARRSGQSLSAFVLARALPSARVEFERLLAALASRGEREDRRHLLAEVNDFLAAAAPFELAEAVADADLEGLSPFLRNYLAAMVELACQQKRIAPPAWAAGVRPLDEPYFAADLPALRLHLLRSSPLAFKRRNLFVDASVGDRV